MDNWCSRSSQRCRRSLSSSRDDVHHRTRAEVGQATSVRSRELFNWFIAEDSKDANHSAAGGDHWCTGIEPDLWILSDQRVASKPPVLNALLVTTTSDRIHEHYDLPRVCQGQPRLQCSAKHVQRSFVSA